MKRILIVALTILALNFLVFGCAKSQKAAKSPAQNTQSTQTNQITTQDTTQATNQKQTPAELDAQAEKIQAEIDKLLSDLEKDSDLANLANEKL